MGSFFAKGHDVVFILIHGWTKVLLPFFLTYLLTLEAVTNACKEPGYRKRPKRCFVSTDPVSDVNLILIIRANCEYLKS